MKPKPEKLLLKSYHTVSRERSSAGGFSCGFQLFMQQQWRVLICALLCSLLITLIYWNLQPVAGSSYLFEESSKEPQNLAMYALKSGELPNSPSTNMTLGDKENSSPQNRVETTTTTAGSLPEIKDVRLATLNSTEYLNDRAANFSIPHKHGNLSECPDPPPGLIGRIPVWMDTPEFDQLAKLYTRLGAGGHGWHEECRERHKVAIVVPYRDREAHLRKFLHNLHSLLGKQQLDYAIFIVEQVANQTFNRGKLMNVGYVEASRLYDWQCFIFHDVDLLPEDDRNLYTCPQQPRHMSVAVDKFKYKLPYSSIFGGANAMTSKQFERMNGFSNDYWGWGGEDDDMSERVTYAGYTISRYPTTIARYKMIKHTKESLNLVNDCRWAILKKTKQRWRNDGLSSLEYNVLSTRFNQLYTNITVDLLEKESRKKLSEEHIKEGC